MRSLKMHEMMYNIDMFADEANATNKKERETTMITRDELGRFVSVKRVAPKTKKAAAKKTAKKTETKAVKTPAKKTTKKSSAKKTTK